MQKIKISELKPHPRNNEFFDDITGKKWESFLESVKKQGIIKPIIVTQDYTIVSGHQRVRACKELGIDEVLCDFRTYESEDDILRDLLAINVEQRGIIGGDEEKMGLRIAERKRLYGVREGGNGSNQYEQQGQNVSVARVKYKDIADMEGLSVKKAQRCEQYAKTNPELKTLVNNGVISKTTAISISKLPEEIQADLISGFDKNKKYTEKEVQKYVEEKKKTERQIDYYEKKVAALTEDNNELNKVRYDNRRMEDELGSIKGKVRYLQDRHTYMENENKKLKGENDDLKHRLGIRKDFREQDNINDILMDDIISFGNNVDMITKTYGHICKDINENIDVLPDSERDTYINKFKKLYDFASDNLEVLANKEEKQQEKNIA